MKLVYIVKDLCMYDYEDIKGVFSTLEAAENEAKKYKGFGVVVVELDVPGVSHPPADGFQ